MNVYDRIKKRFENGEFVDGNYCKLAIPYDSRTKLRYVPIALRTPGYCVNALSYGNGTIDDVPEESRTREFFLHAYTSKSVFEYIKNHISDFDRKFFKDLIATNKYSTMFSDNNCFEIMPLEYIDEEMCSIAALHSKDWTGDGWFRTVLRRKKEVLTADLFKYAVKIYPALSTDNNDEIFNIVPKSFIDDEFYYCLLSDNAIVRVKLDTNSDNIMDYIPKHILTPELLKRLVDEKPRNLCRFNNYGLNVIIDYYYGGKAYEEELWKYAIRRYGEDAISSMPLNDENVNFFLSLYPKDSMEYFRFKRLYKEYKMKRDNSKEYEDRNKRIQDEMTLTAADILGEVLFNDEDLDVAIKKDAKRRRKKNSKSLPIEYRGLVPSEYAKDYDSEEYLELVYKSLGIQIVNQKDYFFYDVILPEGYYIINDGYYNYLVDSNGREVITFFYDSKAYDMAAYVSNINLEKELKLTL